MPGSSVTIISSVNSRASASAVSLGARRSGSSSGVSTTIVTRPPIANGRPTLPISNRPERRVARVLEQPRDDQVGRGADQRDRAAHDRGEADRHQVARRRAARCGAPTTTTPGIDHGDDRRVVQERRGGRPWARAAAPARRARPARAGAARARGDTRATSVSSTRVRPAAAATHVEGGDGQRRGVREARRTPASLSITPRDEQGDRRPPRTVSAGDSRSVTSDGQHDDDDREGDDGVGAHDRASCPSGGRAGDAAGPHGRRGSDE